MSKEKELLRKQLALLAEQSKGACDREVCEISAAMCRVYKTLVTERLILLTALGAALSFDLAVCGGIQIIKLFRRKL